MSIEKIIAENPKNQLFFEVLLFQFHIVSAL